MANEKQLEMHNEKSIVVAIGNEKQVTDIEEELKREPLMFDYFATKKKEKEKWLGDLLSEKGLSESVASTIKERSGRTTACTFEIQAIIDDVRMQSIGGIEAAISLWNLAIVPRLLNNAESWVCISECSYTKLEDLQYTFLRVILQTPASTPKLALLFETGMLSMKFRIYARKLNFINAIKHQDSESLAKQVYLEQVAHNWPGLARECQEICEQLKLPNILEENISIPMWKTLVKKACKSEFEKQIKIEMKDKTKTKDIVNESFEFKKYLKNKNVHEARIAFKMRTKMLDIKMNFQHDIKYMADLWQCDSCRRAVDTQTHVLNCSAYQSQREDKDFGDFNDLVTYYSEVMQIRSKLGLKK